MHLVQRGLSKTRQINTKWRHNRAQLAAMADHSSEVVHRIADAIRTTAAGSESDAERSWFARIDELRREVYGSTQVVNFQSPKNHQTQVFQLGQYARLSSKRAHWCRLLFHLVRELEPRTLLELGTCVGMSTSYQAAALEQNGQGHLTTLDVVGELQESAQSTLAKLNLTDRVSMVLGLFEDTLPGVLEGGVVDQVFVDGHHDEHATWTYYEQILPHLSRGSLVIFDDLDWSPGMKRVWKRLRQDHRVEASVDMVKIGLCVVNPEGGCTPDSFVAAL